LRKFGSGGIIERRIFEGDGTTGTGTRIGSCICSGIGSAIGAIVSGTTVIVKTIRENNGN